MKYTKVLLQKLLVCSFIILASTPAKAQITPDNTLGAESSRLTPNVPIGGENGDRIDGGATRGSNLFHSFSSFNINDGQRVYFGNPAGIQNILTRVTGGNASNILGTLGVDGGANLFLLNPNGIIFGQNASLDVRGSFVGTTANAFQFGNQGNFSATNPQAPPLLTVNPSALLFTQLKTNAGITNQSIAPAGVNPEGDQTTGLRVPDGKSLLLVGSNVNLDGGIIRAYGGRVELTGLSAPGSIGLNAAGDTLNLNILNDVPRADVSLTNAAAIYVFGAGGGDIAINARNLEISNSALFAGIVKNLGNTGIQAGDITLNATGAITVGQSSFIINGVNRDAINNGGNINITTGSLSLTDGAQVSTSTSGIKNAGNLTVRAADSVEVSGDSKSTGLFALVNEEAAGSGGNLTVETERLTVSGARARISTSTSGEGNAGNLTITTGRLSLSDRGQVTAITNRIGDAGDLTVRAIDTVEVSDHSILSTNVNQRAQGTGGNLTVDTGRLSVSDGAEVSASTFGIGDAGALTIRASDFVEVTGAGSGLFADVEEAEGTGGDLTIETGRLSIRDGANVDVSTSGEGNAGNLLVQARDSVEVVGAGSFLNASGDIGIGGNLTVETGQLTVRDGAQVQAVTFGSGPSGTLTVRASESIELSGSGTTADGQVPSGLFAGVGQTATGAGGNLTVETERLSISDGAQVTVTTFGSGNAGFLTVRATEVELSGTTADGQASSGLFAAVEQTATGAGGNLIVETERLSISDGASVSASTSGIGDGGNLTVKTGSLNVSDGAVMSVDTFAGGKAGNLLVQARDAVEVVGAGSFLRADVNEGASGTGGNVTVETERLSVWDGAQIAASTFGSGSSGTLVVRATDSVELSGTAATADGLYRSGLFTSAELGATGAGGNLTVQTGRLSISDGAVASASSQGSGDAGNLEVAARSILLDNSGKLTAETASGQGGNITLRSQDLLLLRNNSNISTTAGTASAGGDGGNITINTPIIVAVPNENSDITANAFSGRGGNISISASSIFGIQARSQLTPQSDITASSQLGAPGQISFTEPNVQPTQGLVELPASVLDASDQIAQVCPNGANASRPLGEFVVTGRGSLPPNPLELMAGTTSLSPLASIEGDLEANTSPQTSKSPAIITTPNPIVEAQGWVQTQDGKIALVASAPQATPVATTVQATCQ